MTPWLPVLIVAISLCRPAFAQMDLSGDWSLRRGHEEGGNEIIGDYTGLPLNEAGRLRADSWTPSLLSVSEHQCAPHGADRIDNFTNLRIWKQVDLNTQQLIAYHLNVEWHNAHRVIYMDGRAHPSEDAPHTWMGFSTGRWDGDMLVITTTHMKESWLRRNGVPRSEKATVTERLIRHGNYLNWTFIVQDPAYLTEPYIRSRPYVYDLHQVPFGRYVCEIITESARPAYDIPHHLPGMNKDIAEFTGEFGLAPETARGGAETTYPEYRLRLRDLARKENQ
jgi:hypothetical protein